MSNAPGTPLQPSPSLVVEAALLCAGRSLTATELVALFAGELDEPTICHLVEEVGQRWLDEGRGFELAGDLAGWRVRSRAQVAGHINRLLPQPRQTYSKAVRETLAVIAYLQPVTRTVIEQTRGRAVTPGVMQQLEERGWIEVIGHQESPGRPALYATTFKFLDDLGLMSIADLPPLDELPVVGSLTETPVAADLDPDDPWEGEDPRVHPELSLDATPTPEALLNIPPLAPTATSPLNPAEPDS